MIKSLDNTEKRVSKMLNEQSLGLLNEVKKELITLALLSLNR